MHKQSVVFTLFVAAVLTACTDGDARLNPVEPALATQATTPGFQPNIGLGSSVLSTERTGDARCPEFPPFAVPVNLIVGADGADVTVDAVRLRFADVVGVTLPQVTFSPPSLMSLFGSTIVPANSSRTFPFVFRFGCGTARSGTLIIIVDTRDSRGRKTSKELRARIVDSR